MFGIALEGFENLSGVKSCLQARTFGIEQLHWRIIQDEG